MFLSQIHPFNSLHKIPCGRHKYSLNSDVCFSTDISVADPGFPAGRCGPIRRAWTSDAGTFWQRCMQKRKNLVPWGGGGWRAPGTVPRSANVFDVTD